MTYQNPGSDQGVPEQIRVAATQNGLGEHRVCYRGTATWNIPRLIAVVVAVGIALGPLHTAVNSTAAVAVLIVLFVGEFLLEKGYLAARSRLDLFEHGLILVRGDRIFIVRYDATALTQRNSKGPLVSRYRSTVRDITGANVSITGIEQPIEWSRAIRAAVTEAQLPAAWAALEAGQRLDFGKFWITAQQVGYGTTAWPWSEVRGVEVTRGVVKVWRNGSYGGLAGAVSSVPNFLLFITLAERLRTTSPA